MQSKILNQYRLSSTFSVRTRCLNCWMPSYLTTLVSCSFYTSHGISFQVSCTYVPLLSWSCGAFNWSAPRQHFGFSFDTFTHFNSLAVFTFINIFNIFTRFFWFHKFHTGWNEPSSQKVLEKNSPQPPPSLICAGYKFVEPLNFDLGRILADNGPRVPMVFLLHERYFKKLDMFWWPFSVWPYLCKFVFNVCLSAFGEVA